MVSLTICLWRVVNALDVLASRYFGRKSNRSFSSLKLNLVYMYLLPYFIHVLYAWLLMHYKHESICVYLWGLKIFTEIELSIKYPVKDIFIHVVHHTIYRLSSSQANQSRVIVWVFMSESLLRERGQFFLQLNSTALRSMYTTNHIRVKWNTSDTGQIYV